VPTLTFYVTDEVARQLEKVIARRSEKLGFVVSRGDILVPHIKDEYKKEFPKNGTAPKAEPVTVNEEGKQ